MDTSAEQAVPALTIDTTLPTPDPDVHLARRGAPNLWAGTTRRASRVAVVDAAAVRGQPHLTPVEWIGQ